MKIKLEDMEYECSVSEFLQIKEMLDLKKIIKEKVTNYFDSCKNKEAPKTKEKSVTRNKPTKGVKISSYKRANRKENEKKYDVAVRLFKKGGISKAKALRKAGLPVKGSYYTILDKKVKMAK